jgi:valyl-tRNA synthetase
MNGVFGNGEQAADPTARHTQSHTPGHTPSHTGVAGLTTPKETVNRWIIGETARVRVAVDEALTAYRFNDAAGALYAFVWGRVCDWYVEFSKPLLMDGTPEQKAETRETMAWVLDQCVILLHPFMPFITEELWTLMGTRAKPCAHADWPDYGLDLIDKDADREMNWAISLIENIRSARAEMHVPAGLHLKMLSLSLDAAGTEAWAKNEVLIKRLARIETLEPTTAAPKGAVTITVEGATFALPLAGIIDVAAEKARLSKALEKVDKDLAGLNGRLKNPKFVESAPEEVVEETRDLQAAKSEEAAKLKTALARLKDLE